jgi:hypothetical protein
MTWKHREPSDDSICELVVQLVQVVELVAAGACGNSGGAVRGRSTLMSCTGIGGSWCLWEQWWCRPRSFHANVMYRNWWQLVPVGAVV